MTDRRGQSTEDAAPDSFEEAADNIRHDPALANAGTGTDPNADAATDDDARTSDTAQRGDNRTS